MVLLTSSAVSVVISGSIVCTFTFLLFLSGYVLQQQTVRSLQDALRNPPEKISFPTPTLPPQFQVVREDEVQAGNSHGQQIVISNSATRRIIEHSNQEISLRSLWDEYVGGSGSPNGVTDEFVNTESTRIEEGKSETTEMITSQERLGYILAMPDTRSLCSAVLFAKRHKHSTRLMIPPKMVFIYPATWDVSGDPVHLAAMDTLRDVQDNSGVTLHPVAISRVWAGISVEQQLLSELQRYRWPYDRAMYLHSPGMTIDTTVLDEGLAVSDTKSSWTLLHPNPKSYEASHPPVLLWAAGRGLLYPRKDLKRLTSCASVEHGSKRTSERKADLEARHAAYITFDEKDLRNQAYKGLTNGGIFERYDRDRREACAGTGLII